MTSSISSLGSALSAQDMSASGSTGEKSVIEQIMAKLIDNFAKSYSKTEDQSDEEKAKEAAIKDIISKADTDKDGSVSKAELSAYAKTDEGTGNKILNQLLTSFDSLDTNKDGKLSLDEMKKLLNRKEFSMQEMKAINDEFNNPDKNDSALGSTGKSLPILAQKIIDNYDSSNL